MSKVLIARPVSRYFYPWALTLVSTVNEEGTPNIITIGASSICSSNPPTVGVAIGTAQYSLALIEKTGDFGVNIPRASQVYETDFCGSHSGRTVNKFEALGWTVQKSSAITSPLIAECPVSMECKVIQTVPLGGHAWVIGQIVAVHVEEELLGEGGRLDVPGAEPLLGFWGEYFGLGEKLAEWNYTRRS
jgi:flavin reductase (DIM6/NTAB) family NADH-FMN oxidoreductase RutF